MNKIVAKNIRAYDSTVEEYYDNTKNLEEPEIQQRKEFLSLVEKGGKILDLGCGPGRDSKIFSERGYNVIGIDLSEKSIEKARIIAPKATFETGDVLHLDVKDGSFDAVWFNAGLLCIEKKFALNVLKNINRIITVRGILYVSVKEGAGEGFELDKRYGVQKYFAYYSEDEIRKLLVTAGFEILKTFRPDLKSKYHTHQWIGFFCRKI